MYDSFHPAFQQPPNAGAIRLPLDDLPRRRVNAALYVLRCLRRSRVGTLIFPQQGTRHRMPTALIDLTDRGWVQVTRWRFEDGPAFVATLLR